MVVKPQKLKVGFDISQTGKNKAGCGYFAHSLLSASQKHSLALDWHLFPHFGDFYFDGLMPVTNTYQQGSYGPHLKSIDLAKNFWNHPKLELKISDVDIVHSNNFWCPTLLKNTKLIYTLYDLGFIKNHQWTTEENRMGCFDGVFKASAFADGMVSISVYSKNHFLEIFPQYPEDRIEVIYPCSRFEGIELSKKIPNRLKVLKDHAFWLSVGTIEPRKNQKFLLHVYADYLSKTKSPYPLVFAGKKGWLMDDFELHIQKLGLEKHVLLLGYVSDEELGWLYQHCFANLYPSLFEGFGLPVLEGIQLGAPTIASNESSMPEILQDGVLLSPYDKNIWVDAMLELQIDSQWRNSLIEKGYRAGQKFSWEKSAQKLENFYHKINSMPDLNLKA